MAAAANSQSLNPRLHPSLHQELEDNVSGELMTQAVTVVPCGHIFNEDTVIQLLASSKLCPLDRRAIEQHVPNYSIRSLAERIQQGLNGPQEEVISEEAQRHFLRGKELADQGDKEKALPALLKALQLFPTYEKAQGYLEFCLGVPSSHSSKQAASSQSPKDQYLDLLVRLLDDSLIQQNSDLLGILEAQFDELMSTSNSTLSQKASEMYLLIKRLLVDGKVSQFVTKRLSQLHAQPQKQVPLAQAALPPPQPAVSSALEKELREFIKQNAFGSIKWMECFGGVSVEPLPPLDIKEKLDQPCPFWPGKKIKDTHRLIFIPTTVCGEPLTLKLLGSLIQKPRQGNPNKYTHFDLGNYQDCSLASGKWGLVTIDPIPETEGKSYADQQKILAIYCKNFGMRYEVSRTLDTAITLCMEYLGSSRKLAYSRCQETYSNTQQVCLSILKDKGVAIKGESLTISCPVAPVFPPAPKPPVFNPEPKPLTVSPFPLYVKPPEPLDYQKAQQEIGRLSSELCRLQASLNRLEKELRDTGSWDYDFEKRGKLYDRISRLKTPIGELEKRIETAEEQDVIKNYHEKCRQNELIHEQKKKEHYEAHAQVLSSASLPLAPYTNPPEPWDYQKAQENIQRLELKLAKESLSCESRDVLERHLREAKENPAIKKYHEDCIKSKTFQKERYYIARFEGQLSVVLTPPQPFYFSPFHPYVDPPESLSYQEAQEQIKKIESRLFSDYRRRMHFDNTEIEQELEAARKQHAIINYDKDRSNAFRLYDNHKNEYETCCKNYAAVYEEHKKEYEIQRRVSQELYEKKKKEQEALCLRIRNAYETPRREYEEDQKDFSHIGIRAQLVL